MARKFVTNVEFDGNQALNIRLHQSAGDLSTLTAGKVWFDTNKVRPVWAAGTSVVNDIYPFASANTANTGVLRDGSGNFTAGVITVTSMTINGTPTNNTDATTKAYVDALVQGLDLKNSCRCATTTTLPAYTYSSTAGGTLTANAFGAFPTIDTSITMTAGQSILVKDEVSGNAKYNGIYTLDVVGNGSTAWVLTRRADANSDAKVTSGMYTFISEGTANADNGYALMTLDPISLNVTALAFSQFSGAGQITAGMGLYKNGNTLQMGTGASGSYANGVIPIGNGTGYTYSTLTQGSGITITNTSGVITIAANNSGTLTGTLTSGRVPYANGTSSLTDSAKMVFDATLGFNVNAASSGGNNLTLGTGAGTDLTSGSGNVMVGPGGSGTAAGSNLTTGSDNIYIGYNCKYNGTPVSGDTNANVIIGRDAANEANANSNVAIGASTSAKYSNCVILGREAAAKADNQLVIGASGRQIANVFIGQGVTATSPTDVTYNASGASGTDAAGSNLNIAGGRGTGTGVGGTINFQTAKATTTGNTLNTLVTRHSILQDGGVDWTGITTATAPAVSASNHGTIFYDSTLQKFRYSVNGGAYADLVVTVASTALDGTFAINNTADQTKQFKWSLGNQATGSIVTLTTLATQATATLNIPVITTSDTLAMLGLGQTFTGSNIFQNAGNKFLAAATQDAITIAPRAGGTSSYVTSITTGTLTGSYTMTLPATAAGDTFSLLGLGQTYTGAKVFQNAGTKFIAAATQDAITIAPRAGGTGSFITSITTGTLTGSYTMTLPVTAAGDTFMLLGLAQTITGAKSFTTANLTITDVNIVLSATTGTQFGTATTQKLGFYGATAVVQPIAQDVATALTTLGLMATGGTYAAASVSGTLPINHGGTGLTSTSQNYAFLGPVSGGAGAPTWRAIDAADLPAAVTKKYSVDVGDGASLVYVITHSLGSLDVVAQVYDKGTLAQVECDVVHTSTTQVTLTFTAPIPTSAQYRVVVVG